MKRKKIKKILDLKRYDEKQMEWFLFFISFFVTFLLATFLSYNFDFTENFNLLFDSDCSRVIKDASDIFYEHYRLGVHPLYVILVQPLVLILTGITSNRMISLVILSSVVTSMGVVYIYRILSLYNKDNIFKSIICFFYLFSYSSMIFTAGIEIYNIAALFLIILWYYTLKKLKEDKYNKYSYAILAILGLISASFTITNFIVFLIAMFVLFLSKKVKIKYLIVLTISSGVLLLGINYYQNIIWHNTSLIWQQDYVQEAETYNKRYTFTRMVENVIGNDYYNSILGSNSSIKVISNVYYMGNNYVMQIHDPSPINLLVLTIFYILTIILIVRNYKKNYLINIGLSLSLLFNTILHLLYGNDSTFLYSQHFLYLIVLMFGINYSFEKNTKLKKIAVGYLIFLILLELIINSYQFLNVLLLIKDFLNKTYYLSTLGYKKTLLLECGVAFVITTSLILLLWMIKKFLKEKQQDKKIFLGIVSIAIAIFMETIFIGIETTSYYNGILNITLHPIENNPIIKRKTSYLNEEFESRFKEDIVFLDEYIKEYDDFLSTHDFELKYDLNKVDYFFFGMGNRRKLLFRKNVLIDIETKEEIEKFNVKEILIIPNNYTVLIQTEGNEFIKIQEDEEGVHYIKNGKDTILEGTSTKINLYRFENEKYQNMKKVLYSEILFNVKDNRIYPNIIVYDNPLYKDEEIIKKIQEEASLKEILNILSTGENTNYELSNEMEVNRNFYPLSWEQESPEANYDNMEILNVYYRYQKISPVHSKNALDLLLRLMNDSENS